jgi:large subunit ribosomal protein L25
MAEVLQVTQREGFGSRQSRRLRSAGQIPAVLYGHGQETVCLTLSADQVAAALRHGSKLVELQGAVSESALISEVQWDAFGSDVLHLDLTRVSATERVEVTVAIELKGTAPGVLAGGQLQHVLHDVRIVCRASAIPERLEVKLADLQLGESITLEQVALPPGVELASDPTEVVAHCHEVIEEAAEELAGADLAEPELIRRKEDEEGED